MLAHGADLRAASLGRAAAGRGLAALVALALVLRPPRLHPLFPADRIGRRDQLLLVTFLIPVTAILLGAILLGERLAPRHFVGMALIAAGLALIDGRVFARRAPTPA